MRVEKLLPPYAYHGEYRVVFEQFSAPVTFWNRDSQRYEAKMLRFRNVRVFIHFHDDIFDDIKDFVDVLDAVGARVHWAVAEKTLKRCSQFPQWDDMILLQMEQAAINVFVDMLRSGELP